MLFEGQRENTNNTLTSKIELQYEITATQILFFKNYTIQKGMTYLHFFLSFFEF